MDFKFNRNIKVGKEACRNLMKVEVEALFNWFGLLKDSDESNFKHVEDLFLKGKLEGLKILTQRYYRKKGITVIHAYRWEGNIRKNRVLESWVPDIYDGIYGHEIVKAELIAKDYAKPRGGIGKLIERDIPVENILFDVTALSDSYYLDELLGVQPQFEIVVINS